MNSTKNKFFLLAKKKIEKKFLWLKIWLGKKNKAGRNNAGKITTRHKGGGHKKKYRKITFIRTTDSIGIVTSIEYDPYRTAFIASVYNLLNMTYFYIIAPKNLNVGNIVNSGYSAHIKIGHSLPLIKVPIGTFIHNITLKENKKAQMTRSAGTSAQLIEKTSEHCRILISSGTYISLSPACQATIGTVSNEFSFFNKIGKAGRNRWLNKRPAVRGVAMNPIDHPHGGGEGKSSGGRSSVTPWGKPTKNKKTSNKKKTKFQNHFT